MASWTSDSYDGRYLQLTISESADAISNTSTLYWTLTSDGGSVNYYTIGTTTVTIDGTEVYYKAQTSWDAKVFPAAKGSVSGSITITHNSGGDKTIAVGFSTRVYAYAPIEYGGDMTLTSLDRTAPYIGLSTSSVTASSVIITATSNVTADILDYSLNGGSSWTNWTTSFGTSASRVISGLSPNTTYSIVVRARKSSNHIYGTSSTKYITTLGNSLLNSVNTLTIDAASPVLTMNWTVYSSYTHTLVIKNGSTTVLTMTGLTCSTGTNNKTITLTSAQRSTILTYMANMASFTATYYLTTYSGSTQIGSTVSRTAVITTTSATSKPTFTGFSHSDTNSATVAVTENNSKYIMGCSSLMVVSNTATARNGASIISYMATVGSKSVTSSTTTISFGTMSTYGNVTLTVTVTDSRGYTTSVSQVITVVDYSKIQTTEYTIRRVNEVEPTVQFTFQGTLSPVTINGTAMNSLQTARLYYKKTSDTSYTWCALHPTATTSSYSFSTDALSNSDGVIVFDPNSAYNLRLTISDELYSDTLEILLYKGTPIVSFRAGKVGIDNPDPQSALDVTGEITQNSVFILGFVGKVETDFNNYKSGGIFHYSGTGVSNAPGSAGFLEVITNGNGYVIQRFTEHTAGCALYVRAFYNNSTWTAWTTK